MHPAAKACQATLAIIHEEMHASDFWDCFWKFLWYMKIVQDNWYTCKLSSPITAFSLFFSYNYIFFLRIVPFSFKSWHPWLFFQMETTLVNFFLYSPLKISLCFLGHGNCHLTTAPSLKLSSVPSRMSFIVYKTCIILTSLHLIQLLQGWHTSVASL